MASEAGPGNAVFLDNGGRAVQCWPVAWWLTVWAEELALVRPDRADDARDAIEGQLTELPDCII